jgi:hypothetical protein
MTETVLILRTCRADGTSYNNFQWPASGPVEAPDFDPEPHCGGGLHGLLWGEGKVGLLDLSPGAQWKVFRAHVSDVVQLTDKCKARRGVVEYSGDREGAIKYLYEHGASGKAVVFGTSTSGDGGTSTSGYCGISTSGYCGISTSGDCGISTSGDHGTSTSGDGGTSTSGNHGTSTSGDGGTSTSGNHGTSTSGDGGTSTSGYCGISTSGYCGISTSGDCGISTSGDFGTSTSGDGGTSKSGNRGTSKSGVGGTSKSGVGGTSTAGYGGTIAITYWNGKRYETRVATVKDEDGDGELEPNTPYCLNERGEFVQAATEAKN